MLWLQRHAWWGLLALAAILIVRGLIDLASGVTWQAEDVTGKTLTQIAAESGAGSQLSDFSVRSSGLYLIVLGILVAATLLFAFRRDHRWAWWAAWTLPLTTIASSVLYVAFGVVGPPITSAILGGLATAILLISAPRFFRRPKPL